jgi:hypothetical protein
VPQQGNFVLWLLSRPLGKLLGWGKAPVIAEMSESSVLSYQRPLWKQAGRKRDVATSHSRGILLFWLQSRHFPLVARNLESARDHSYEWIKGGILPVSTVEARGRKIGRHYQPKQRNFVVLVTFTTFHARCSGAGGRPRSQLRVDQG